MLRYTTTVHLAIALAISLLFSCVFPDFIGKMCMNFYSYDFVFIDQLSHVILDVTILFLCH